MKKSWVLVGIFIITSFLVVLFSLRDQALTPEAIALIKYLPPKVDYQQNIFVAAAGFYAAQNKNFMAEGEKAIKDYNLPIAKSFPPDSIVFHEKFSSDFIKFCNTLSLNQVCWNNDIYKKEIAQNIANNQVLIQRYLHMQQLPVFVNTIKYPERMILGYKTIKAISRLLAMQALIDIKNGHTEQGFNFIEHDILFYRHILSGHATLVESLNANAQLSVYYNLLSLLLIEPSFPANKYAQRLEALLAPFPPKDKNMRIGFLLNERILMNIINDQPANNSITYKKNMTLNEFAQSNMLLMKYLDSLNDNNLLEKQRELEKNYKNAHKTSYVSFLIKKRGILFWRNAVGDQLFIYPRINPWNNLLLNYDMNASARLVRTQLELILDKTPAEEVPAKLKQLGAKFFNPLTRQPFIWNAQHKTLSFIPHKNSIQRFWANNLLEVHLP